MKIFGIDLQDKTVRESAVAHAKNIGIGTLGGYFVVYPIVMHAAQTTREGLPSFTKVMINRVVSPVLTGFTSAVAPIVPAVSKIGMIVFAGTATYQYYQTHERYTKANPLSNLLTLGMDTSKTLRSWTVALIDKVRHSGIEINFSFLFKKKENLLGFEQQKSNTMTSNSSTHVTVNSITTTTTTTLLEGSETGDGDGSHNHSNADLNDNQRTE